MTYEQIEKEFDELFVKKVMLIDEPDKLAYEEMKWQIEPKAIKSFLKQSFIKYLNGEVERLENKRDIQSEILAVNINDEYEGGIMDCLDKQIDYYQAQIKELEK